MKEEKKAIALAGVAVLSWSTVATAFKIALTHLTHFEMLLVASSTALILFAALLTQQRKWRLLSSLSLREWGQFAWIGLLNPVAYYLVLFKAYSLLPAQVAQPINYAWPIVLLLLLAAFTGQPIPRKKYIGLIGSLIGVAIISSGSGSIDSGNLPPQGLLLAALSALLWAAFWMVNKKRKTIDPTVSLFLSFLFGTFYLVIGACVIGVHLSTLPGLLSGIYVGCFEIGIPFICFGLAMRKTNNPALINQLCYLSPFLSLFFIHLILGEQIAAGTYIGLLLIVSGIAYNEFTST